MKEIVIDKCDANQTLFKFLKKKLPNANDSFLYKMLRKKNIKLNNDKATGREKLFENDKIYIYFSDETYNIFAEKQAIDVEEYLKAFKSLKNIKTVYEDEDMVVFDKPSNVLSQKASPTDISINEYLIGYLLENNKITKESLNTFKPSVVNRLDRNTKGLIIGAKSLRGAQTLSLLIKRREIKKYYKASCVGKINLNGIYKAYLFKDEKTNKVYISDSYKEGYSEIETRIVPLAIMDETSDVLVELITGKTHQIRAHLSYLGFPLVGDPKYGNAEFNKNHKANMQNLISWKIEFPKNVDIDKWKGLVITAR